MGSIFYHFSSEDEGLINLKPFHMKARPRNGSFGSLSLVNYSCQNIKKFSNWKIGANRIIIGCNNKPTTGSFENTIPHTLHK